MPESAVAPTDEPLTSDEEFRRLHEEHQECERRLETLQAQSLLAEEDELEAKRLKRHKLTLKDRMAEIERERAAAGAPALASHGVSA